MKVLVVTLTTVVPFGFFILAAIIAFRYMLGLPVGPQMLGLEDADWASAARRSIARLRRVPCL